MLEKGFPLDVRTVPAVIAGDPENRHGIILAKSIPAKRSGITTALSLWEAKLKCPDLLVFPPDYDLYLDCSNAMYTILAQYSPLIQRYSVDESFLDFQETRASGKSAVETAFEIRDRIREELGFTVNVGVGKNKLLAKMACEMEKPDRVHTLLTRDEIREKMHPLPVSELFMVGHASVRKLARLNIHTIGELAAADPALLETLLKSHGRLIWNYANGIDTDPVIPNSSLPERSVGNGMTIPYDVTDGREAEMYLLSLCERVGERVRRRGYKASLFSVSVCTNQFLYFSHQLKLPFFTDDTTTIFRYAVRLFYECWHHEPVRKLGVRAGVFCPRENVQLTFYDRDRLLKDEALNRAVDRIRLRFGTGSIERGVFANTPLRPVEGGVNDGNYLMMGGYGK